MFLRQSTSQVIRFGPCLDRTDAVTEETALTLAQADMRLSKDGAAYAQKNTTGNATHDSDGWYSTTLDTTDTDTVGILKLNVHQPANMLPVWEVFYVVEEAVHDAIYGASAAGPLQSTVAGRPLDVTAGGAAGIDWANVENPTTPLDLSGTDIQLCDTVTTLTGHTAQTGDSFARIGAAGASLTDLGGMSTAMKAEVNVEVLDVLNTDTFAELSSVPAATSTLVDKINWLFALARNKGTQTNSVKSLKNDGDTGNIGTSAISSDGTTFTREEWV